MLLWFDFVTCACLIQGYQHCFISKSRVLGLMKTKHH
ncbi:unnamed protein product [Brassica oleracea]